MDHSNKIAYFQPMIQNQIKNQDFMRITLLQKAIIILVVIEMIKVKYLWHLCNPFLLHSFNFVLLFA